MPDTRHITPVPQLLPRQCYNCRCFITAGEKQFKSLLLDISQVFPSIFHINFHILPQFYCLFLTLSLVGNQLAVPQYKFFYDFGLNFKTFPFQNLNKIHRQIKELFISFLVLKFVFNYLFLYRFGGHLKSKRVSW